MALALGHCWTEIQAGDTIWGPRGALSWGIIQEDTASWSSERCFVKVECAVDLGVGRKIWVNIGFAKEVNGE